MAAMRAPVAKPVFGHAKPRIAPPVPARSGHKDLMTFAEGIGWTLRPWQETVVRYLTAIGPEDRWLYREVAVIVARQNGKTAILIPLIVQRLLDGQRIMHTAQNAKLPRDVHEAVAAILQEHYPKELLPKRAISYAVGHESISLRNGGRYRIVAPTKGGARGPSNDLVIVDELREMVDHDFIAAAKPTLTASAKPQMIYLSNAGTDQSEVLNSIKKRSGEDPALAYLEWSAGPDRKADDLTGWLEANPSIGHDPAVLDTLYTEHRTNRLAGTLGIFETEHLCRWVRTLRERLVDETAWASLEADDLGKSRNAYIGIALDPNYERASVGLAWRLPDAKIAFRLLLDVPAPFDINKLGETIRGLQSTHNARAVGFDPLTDAQLIRYLVRKPEPVAGQKHANASALFADAVASATLTWQDADAVTDDLVWTTRKAHDESGSFQAVRADDERPITAALAAIRAVWLASGRPTGEARIW